MENNSDKLVIKVNAINTKIPNSSALVTKTHDLDKQGLKKKLEDVDKKISNNSGLFKKTH